MNNSVMKIYKYMCLCVFVSIPWTTHTMEIQIDYVTVANQIRLRARQSVEPDVLVHMDHSEGLRLMSDGFVSEDTVIQWLWDVYEVDFHRSEWYDEGAQEMLGYAAVYLHYVMTGLRDGMVVQDVVSESDTESDVTQVYAPVMRG